MRQPPEWWDRLWEGHMKFVGPFLIEWSWGGMLIVMFVLTILYRGY
jgi:hypothetical protein